MQKAITGELLTVKRSLDPLIFPQQNNEMSWIKRLFFREERPFQDRAPRVEVSALHRISFYPHAASTNRPWHLSNISTSGTAFLREPHLPDLKMGDQIQGELDLNDQRHKILTDIRHITQKIVGCEFVAPSSALQAAIENYFAAEILALRLRLIDPKFLKKGNEETVYWFSDGRQNEVYVQIKNGKIQHFHFTFLGNYIEGGAESPLRYGYLKEESTTQMIKPSTLVQLSTQIPTGLLETCKQIVATLSELPADVKSELSTLLTQRL